METTLKRPSPKRTFRSLNVTTAREAIGALTEDSEIYGITRGDINLTDILAHVMNDTASRDVILATWTASKGALTEFNDMVAAHAFNSIRLIVDPSFVTRKPKDCAALHDLFGSDAIRCVMIHAKFAVLTGGRLPVTIRSSMNLNPNRRLESYEISTCPEMANYHLQLSEDIFREFAAPKPGEWQSNSRTPLSMIDAAAPKRLF